MESSAAATQAQKHEMQEQLQEARAQLERASVEQAQLQQTAAGEVADLRAQLQAAQSSHHEQLIALQVRPQALSVTACAR